MEPEGKIEDEILELVNCGLKLFMAGNTIGSINYELDNFKSEKDIERFKDYTLSDFLTLYKIKLLAENKIISKEQATNIIKLFKEKVKVERVINSEEEKERANPNYKSKQLILLNFVKEGLDEIIKKANIVVEDLDLKNILIGLVENEDYSNIPSTKEIEDKLKLLKYE